MESPKIKRKSPKTQKNNQRSEPLSGARCSKVAEKSRKARSVRAHAPLLHESPCAQAPPPLSSSSPLSSVRVLYMSCSDARRSMLQVTTVNGADFPDPRGLNHAEARQLAQTVLIGKVQMLLNCCSMHSLQFVTESGLADAAPCTFIKNISTLLLVATHGGPPPTGEIGEAWAEIASRYSTWFTKQMAHDLIALKPIPENEDPIKMLRQVGVPEKTLLVIGPSKVQPTIAMSQMRSIRCMSFQVTPPPSPRASCPHMQPAI